METFLNLLEHTELYSGWRQWIAGLPDSREVTETILQAWISEICPLKSLHRPGIVKNELDTVTSWDW